MHSTGAGYAASLYRRLYGTDEAVKVQNQWQDNLQKIRRAKVAVLGVPSDTGAGLMRGANFGPLGIREAFLQQFSGYQREILDLGDVICVPQLLHDEMLSESQIASTRRELYPDSKEPFPVSPLSITEQTLMTVTELNPEIKIILLGGDHSVSWPAMLWGHSRFQDNLGILHFDAHTDMMDYRLGVKYCFSTWAFHAHKLFKPHHLMQVGIRTSKKGKDFWTHHFPIEQIWANEIPFQEEAAIEKIVGHFKKLKVREIYISNDIDGTDVKSAPATGTPEAEGLSPEFVLKLIQTMGQEFNVIGGDIVEVAPPLSLDRGARSYRLGGAGPALCSLPRPGKQEAAVLDARRILQAHEPRPRRTRRYAVGRRGGI